MNIIDLKTQIQASYFDYQRLKSALQDDSHERRTIGQLVKRKELTRVKKGLYIWGEKLNVIYSREILANLIYGPSYVSLEYALSFHGLIPERVEVITSVTTKRKKEFETPVGLFSYEHLYIDAFPWGQSLIKFHDGYTAMMATPEKALLDTVSLRIKSTLEISDVENLLFADLRIDESNFNRLNRSKLLELATYYKSSNVKIFTHYLKLRGQNG